ncbi:glycosyltransferase family 5 protein [Xylona heveae TC161]|uniref:alpha-1,3-glucan synthase n=1 Tax=Xylona heveae (strain CBS 132557 / TC161) TaxID=1328760 RepID=A0A165IVS1_XYLHT|nr:glycosyltransferase family 5 protein [Xylona heveae TC161]KZF25449.1 glycosyltransferase family 5 protein [Xylona heveae TC161]
MLGFPAAGLWVLLTASIVSGLRYDSEQIPWNLNQNQSATNPVDYWGEWTGHSYTPSPDSWRFPFYTVFPDRFVNGDPTNDDANGTYFEHDIMGNQLRHGGDLAGLVDSLDYLRGMGMKGIYIAGSPFINQPWGADGYSPLDLTLLDHHLGTIDVWRQAVAEIHKRGMYVILDNTFGTLGDLIGFKGYLNATAPFTLKGHKVEWKTDRIYRDFNFSNTWQDNCQFPRFWLETGYPVGSDVTDQLKGCYNGEFDQQFGDTEAFGVFPDWQRQLSKFASVQDRLREWDPEVLEKIQHFSCLAIAMLDVDGYRFDKATQVTVDAMAQFNAYIRDCAARYGKHNFFMPGEITGGNVFGSIYLGRGRQPDMTPSSNLTAVTMTNNSSESFFLRDHGENALDAAAFHYTVYRTLTRFLGMDGNLESGYDTPPNWVEMWEYMLLTNDLVNPSTGLFDPRHMYGATNQDVFRWPAIANGTERMLLGLFITTLHMPGIPLVLWGEEQAFYILDNTASNYLFGRQAMSPARAWQIHGCYEIGSGQYYRFPVDSATDGCHDPTVSLDHRDPTHPIRNIMKSMYHMRSNFPALNDGYYLQQLSNFTENVYYPGSNGTPTETGMWSVLRSIWDGVQDFDDVGQGNQSVWLLYSNMNRTHNYVFDCKSNDTALIAPFVTGTTVKNLFYPFDEFELVDSPQNWTFTKSKKVNGCYGSLTMEAYSFRAYVPKDKFVEPPPMLTGFVPGHDARLKSTVAPGKQESINVEFHFSTPMDCDSVTNSISFNSSTEDDTTPSLDKNSVKCQTISAVNTTYVGGIPTTWTWKGTLINVSNGIHAVTLNNATSQAGNVTDAVDRLLFRTGQDDNPIVFPTLANYTQALLHKESDGTLYLSHKAAGADMFRYSLNWGTSFSNWTEYKGGNTTLEPQHWSGAKRQAWKGDHVIVHYYSRLAGSSDAFQHADAVAQSPKRFPHLFLHGAFNQYGFDSGVPNTMTWRGNGMWDFNLMTEWPATFQVNVWGMNPDGQPDQTWVFGDVDGDSVLDRMPPSSLAGNFLNVSEYPPSPYLSYKISVNDGDYTYTLTPSGNRWHQMILFFLLWFVPVITGALAIWAFMKSFYQVKFNQVGVSQKRELIPLALRRKFARSGFSAVPDNASGPLLKLGRAMNSSTNVLDTAAVGAAGASTKRRMVLIATMEYDIEDWKIKIKIGGLGVMAQLMGKNLGHQDLIWVVPCVGGIDYPIDTPAEPMVVTILGKPYEVQVQYHQLHNITYVLLDAPVFRQQSQAEPYPPRMDDLDSAVYYSAWNACIAETIKRFPIDLYHINDYHGAVAPLHLLPNTIPCCLSLHNAEFQGLWPMRSNKERAEVCAVYNLDPSIVKKYVQFGEVFNLLHAGASYLRVHQKGFGAVGVSKKYGKRSYARYPIFWGLTKVGQLPNPDPSDTAEWDRNEAQRGDDIRIDPEYEGSRGDLRRQAQEWAGLNVDPNAELFVFVGRWSTQKGVDLIADVFPAVLEAHPKVQLICVGPVIDLYGKFAALKLGKMMELYPGRVFSRPEFTALPPYIFSGAEFALIPSRDEPFGLVAVEFGRKGALGVGARVGGLGQMPGWWYTVESTTTTHLIHQFKQAIEGALASKTETRAMMRARSAKQRFPVQQWIEDLETLQGNAIRVHNKEASKSGSSTRPPSPMAYNHQFGSELTLPTVASRPVSIVGPPRASWLHRNSSSFFRSPSPGAEEQPPVPGPGLSRKLSLGIRSGPGHNNREKRRRSKSGPIGVAVSEVEDESEEDDIISQYGDEYTVTAEQAQAGRAMGEAYSPGLSPVSHGLSYPRQDHEFEEEPPSLPGTPGAVSPGPHSLGPEDGLLAPVSPFARQENRLSSASVLSLSEVVGDKKDFKLQKVDPFFTDSNGEYYKAFEKRLEALDGKNSEDVMCIEDYLVKSEKKWFDKFRDARLGRGSTPAPSVFRMKRQPSPTGSIFNEDLDAEHNNSSDSHDESVKNEFLLGQDYVPPSGLKKYLQFRIGDWPVYSFFIALGQIIAANSYQITLLTGQVGESAEKLYVIASIYLATSVIWWILFRRLKSVYVLSIPFLFYGAAFFLIGMAPFVHHVAGRGWVQNVGTGMYAVASSSGSIFFALNFGDEGGAPVKSWVFRACAVQGTQQIYIVALWFWGSYLTKLTDMGVTEASPISITWKMTAITVPIACFMWVIGWLLFVGLPDYYRQVPGKVPSFYMTLFRRRIILWFFVTVILQNYWLSAPYGRNWLYLWSSNHAKAWQIIVLVAAFFIGAWAAFLWFFSVLSKDHSWILPVFAIGLGAPRWCQMLWGISNIGQYVPWAGGPVAGALVGRSIWLWLGTLDAIQGVGFGMILLQTLTRIHIAFTLIAAQVLGSIATILARATAPDQIGPGGVFPDFSGSITDGLKQPYFWVALIFQLIICAGFFLFFRKEQLSKP